jgi:hypothetical protein
MSEETDSNGGVEASPPEAGPRETNANPPKDTFAAVPTTPAVTRAAARPSGRYPADSESIEKRVVRYQFAIQRCAYVGAGYGGVFLLAGLGGDRVFGQTWWWVEPVLASLITLGIVLLALAYLRFGWSSRDLRLKDAEPAGAYPKAAHYMYVASVVLLITVAAAVLTATWVVLAADQTSMPAAPTGTRSP